MVERVSLLEEVRRKMLDGMDFGIWCYRGYYGKY